MSGRETPRRLARIVYCSSQRPITVPSLNFAPMNEAAGEPSVIGFTRTVTSAPGGNVLGAPPCRRSWFGLPPPQRLPGNGIDRVSTVLVTRLVVRTRAVRLALVTPRRDPGSRQRDQAFVLVLDLAIGG